MKEKRGKEGVEREKVSWGMNNKKVVKYEQVFTFFFEGKKGRRGVVMVHPWVTRLEKRKRVVGLQIIDK